MNKTVATAFIAFALALPGISVAAPPNAAAATSAWIPADGPGHTGGKFRHKRSFYVMKLGRQHHSSVDVIVPPGTSAELEGKFAYGKVSKDLEDEDVTLWLHSPSGWRRLTTQRTNDDGRAHFIVAGGFLRKPGAHRFALVVEGDGSAAYGTIWVIEAKTRVSIFDIDGTLTTGDRELVEFIATGNKVRMRPGADELVRHWSERGVQPIYLTGRPYLYNKDTKVWLQKHGFPVGPLATTKFVGQGMPSEDGVGAFKQRWIERAIKAAAIDIVAAYGNAKTDVCAFARAGIAPESMFIIGKNGGTGCDSLGKSRTIHSYGAHLRQLEQR